MKNISNYFDDTIKIIINEILFLMALISFVAIYRYIFARKLKCFNFKFLSKWTKRYLSNGNEALKDNKRGPKNYSVNLDSLNEIDRLKHELEVERKKRESAELKVEVLKKKQDIEEKLYRK